MTRRVLTTWTECVSVYADGRGWRMQAEHGRLICLADAPSGADRVVRVYNTIK